MKILFSFLIFGLTFFSCTSDKEIKPLNVIFILADDLGYNELGCYGQTKIETPNIDALAKSGMRFTQHYSGSPVCAPSRYMLLTGKHPGHAFVRGNDEWKSRGDVWNFEAVASDSNLEGQRPIPSETITIAELLKTNGYATGMVGKWGLGAPMTESIPTKQGFDFFYGYNCQRQAHTYFPKHLWKNEEKVVLNNKIIPPHQGLKNPADSMKRSVYDFFHQEDYAPTLMHMEAMQFINTYKDSAFFLYYASPIPHLPLQAPKRWVEYYEKKFGTEKPYKGDKAYFPNYTPRATYAAMVSYLDEQVGEIFSKLKEEGIYENTLIIFTSDNGPTYDIGGADSQFFESALPFQSDKGWGKGFVHEGGLRVPMIASWPSHIEAGSTSNHISAFWDWLPTLCELTNIKTNTNSDGISFVASLLQNEKQTPRDYLYWEIPEYGGQQAVRMGKWKAIRKDILKGNLSIELFDLNEDISCQKNVSAENPNVISQIETIMKKEHKTSEIERFQMPKIDKILAND